MREKYINYKSLNVFNSLISFYPQDFSSFPAGITDFVTLKVSDIFGKEVATLVNENQSAKGGAGSYSVEFDGNNFSSGIYFYNLEMKNPSTHLGQVLSETKRMILIK